MSKPDAARLRITLLDLDPAPWRLVDIPLSMTFKSLHGTIQAAFLWLDYHLWEFDYGNRRYGLPFDDGFGGPKTYNATTARLTRLADGKIKSFLYTYDMGDNWQHRIDVVDLFEMQTGTRLPRLVEGEWRTPPEDVGGSPGFEMFLEALSDPDHEEHATMLEWHGGPFDAQDIQRDVVDIHISRLAHMRRPKQ